MPPWRVVPAWRSSVARLGRRDVADGLKEPSVVEPVHPLQGRELDGLQAAPWPAPMDHLSLVETVDGVGESIVIGISDAADGRLDACFSQAIHVFDGDVLATSVAMVHEPAAMDRPSIMQGLLERIEHEASMHRARGAIILIVDRLREMPSSIRPKEP